MQMSALELFQGDLLLYADAYFNWNLYPTVPSSSGWGGEGCHLPASDTLGGKLQPSLKRRQVLSDSSHLHSPCKIYSGPVTQAQRLFAFLCRIRCREHLTQFSLTVHFRQAGSYFLFIRGSRCVCASTGLLQRWHFTQHDLKRLDSVISCANQEP